MIKEVNKSIFYTICSHEFIVLKLPTERCDSGEHLKIYNDDGLRYCKYCNTLQSFSMDRYLGQLNYFETAIKSLKYTDLVKSLVEDPYNLLPEDLQLIKIIKPELYEYCKLYLTTNKGENK